MDRPKEKSLCFCQAENIKAYIILWDKFLTQKPIKPAASEPVWEIKNNGLPNKKPLLLLATINPSFHHQNILRI